MAFIIEAILKAIDGLQLILRKNLISIIGISLAVRSKIVPPILSIDVCVLRAIKCYCLPSVGTSSTICIYIIVLGLGFWSILDEGIRNHVAVIAKPKPLTVWRLPCVSYRLAILVKVLPGTSWVVPALCERYCRETYCKECCCWQCYENFCLLFHNNALSFFLFEQILINS